jgi:uncharacterized membrane protein YiaA
MIKVYITLALMFFAGVVVYEVSLWNECRATNSFFYCIRVLKS